MILLLMLLLLLLLLLPRGNNSRCCVAEAHPVVAPALNRRAPTQSLRLP